MRWADRLRWCCWGALIVCLVLLWRSVLRVRSAAGRMLALAAVAFFDRTASAGTLEPVGSLSERRRVGGSVQAVLAGVILSAFRLDPAKGGQGTCRGTRLAAP